MRYPPFLIGLCLLFWGMETDRFLAGMIAALLLESSHFITIRYEFDREEFVRLSDLTSLVFIGGVALVLLNYEPVTFLRVTTSWMPLILIPLICAQLFSTTDTIIIGTRIGNKVNAYAHKPLDFRIYYIFTCLFGAAAANSRSLYFFPFLAVILAYFLFANRGRAYKPISFMLCFIRYRGLV